MSEENRFIIGSPAKRPSYFVVHVVRKYLEQRRYIRTGITEADSGNGISPLSVLPELQMRGIGKSLVSEGLALLKGAGAEGCVLVGAPVYYERGSRPKGAVTFHRKFSAKGGWIERLGRRTLESMQDRVRRAVREPVAVVPHDPAWAESFRREKEHLLACLPVDLVRRVEHFGSTAVPGLPAKPIIDILVEVADLEETRSRIAPILEGQGYDYFWRPTHGDDGPPFYAWFIKRDDATGVRTHHIHMVEAHFEEHWDRLLFRDYLAANPDAAERYGELKLGLASAWAEDRLAYSRGKAAFIEAVTEEARHREAT